MQSEQWIDGVYYVKEDGDMAVSEWVDDWEHYVGPDGRMVKKRWQDITGDWYCFDREGRMRKNCWIGKYYVGEDGKWVKGKEKTA